MYVFDNKMIINYTIAKILKKATFLNEIFLKLYI